jgi:hypothetical protein
LELTTVRNLKRPTQQPSPVPLADQLTRAQGARFADRDNPAEPSSFKAILRDLDRHLEHQGKLKNSPQSGSEPFKPEAEKPVTAPATEPPPSPPRQRRFSPSIVIVLCSSFAIGAAAYFITVSQGLFHQDRSRLEARLIGSSGDYRPAIAAWSATSNPIWPPRDIRATQDSPPQKQDTALSTADMLRQLLEKAPQRALEKEAGNAKLLGQLLEWEEKSKKSQ